MIENTGFHKDTLIQATDDRPILKMLQGGERVLGVLFQPD